MTNVRAMLAATPLLLAQAKPLGETGDITYDRLVDLAYAIVKVLLQLGEIAAVGFIVYYGLRMVLSKGDPAKFTAARKGLLLALLGGVIVFGAYVLVDSIQAGVKGIGS